MPIRSKKYAPSIRINDTGYQRNNLINFSESYISVCGINDLQEPNSEE